MRNTLANIWHPLEGMQITDLGERLYLFKFFNELDISQVIIGAPWTFNNHLLIFYRIQENEDPMAVPLVFSDWWVQVHDLPPSFFKDLMALQFGNFLGRFLEYDTKQVLYGYRNYMRIRVQIDELELGWDLKLRALVRRASTVNSIWLREESDSNFGKYHVEMQFGQNSSQNQTRGSWANVHNLLGINLEDIGGCHGACRPKEMKIYCWNVRGLGSLRAVRRFQHMVKLHHPQIVFFMETKLDTSSMEGVRRRCGFCYRVDVPADGSQGLLSIGWNGGQLVALKSFSKIHIDVENQEELSSVAFYGFLWSLRCGDFNDILFAHGKRWGLPWEEDRMEAFRRTLDACQLVDIGFSRLWFTWERGRIMDRNIRERLDKSYEEMIKKLWNVSSGSFLNRMSILALGLKDWARRIKHKRMREVQRLSRRLEELNCEDRSEGNLEELIEVKLHLNMEMDKEERIDDSITTEGKDIENIARDYFSHLFGSRGVGNLEHVLSGVHSCISDSMSQGLLAPYSEEEIVKVLKGMRPTKASGPDDFPAVFYQKFWSIIGKDTSEFCLNILNESCSLEDINRTYIVLIPKTVNPLNLKNFRPISLCTVIYKIIAKTVENCLQEVLDGCIDEA
ncbi:hypothetical protein PVK06_001487 [Gossypium arboreum]|uniref:DUF4283 domain-containing protein n=1 Tax=Gossypium arboreum TaxID=29729 RepID=A0ABR0R267_GOSAR|nr:hypothetical protein PVK06_001487 [Gossypium arboreum]